MLIYSSGGTVTDGYYFWNGTKWLAISTAIARSNYVLVKSAADFPAAVSGVIILLSNTIYEINGTVVLTNMIDLNNSIIRGVGAVDDILLYTPAGGALLTGAHGGFIKNVTLAAPSGGGQVFNLNAAGALLNLIIEECIVANSASIGLISNFGGSVYLGMVVFENNTNGITFQNDNNLVEFNGLWGFTNQNTYEKLVGTFNIIQIFGGDRVTLSANAATALDITGITTVLEGTIKEVMFIGTGTYVNGTFSDLWEVESFGLSTVKDDVASGSFYLTATATTVIASANMPVKMLGTTTAVNLFRVTSPVSNRLTYTGAKTRRCIVVCSLTSTFTGAGSNKYFSFYIAQNGVILPGSKQQVILKNNTDQGPITVSCMVFLAPNDYIEAWVENNTDGTDMIIQNLNLALK